jgi:hypothetical protein
LSHRCHFCFPSPPPPEEIAYVEQPVVEFDDPVYAFAPPPPPPVFFLPPPEPEFIVLPPPLLPAALFVLPMPMFVAMPTYVQAPAYVAPPPNNIIFTNIHNTTVINNVINKTVVNNAAAAVAPNAASSTPGPGTADTAASVSSPPVGPTLPPSVAQKATLIQQQGSRGPSAPAIGPTPPVPGQGPQAKLPSLGNQQPGFPSNNLRPLPGAGGQPLPKPNFAPAATTPTQACALGDSRYLLHDRDTKYTASLLAIIESAHVKTLQLPTRSPNLNAYSERWVRSVREECLSKLILFGERSLRRAMSEYVVHYHKSSGEVQCPVVSSSHGNSL